MERLKPGDVVRVEYPSFYSEDIEFWEMRPYTETVTRLTKRKHNPVIGGFFPRVFDKFTGECVSHTRGKHAPFGYKRARIDRLVTPVVTAEA